VTVVAVPTVDSTGRTTAADYRLTPRDAGDFSFAPLVPYREVAIGSTTLLVAVSMWSLWRRRRSAEVRARELAELNARLQEAKEAAEIASRSPSTCSPRSRTWWNWWPSVPKPSTSTSWSGGNGRRLGASWATADDCARSS
jgi:hypothetical protein